MRSLRLALLHLAMSLLELVTPVVVVVAVPEAPGGGDGQRVDTEVDTKDCLVLGIVRTVGGVAVVSVIVRAVFPRGDMEVELVVHCVVLERTRTKLVVLGQHIPFVRRWAVRRKFKATLEAAINGRKRNVVPVECGAPFVVEHTPRRELRLAYALPVLPPFDAAFGSVNSTPDGFLDEVCGEVGFVPEFVVECVSCGRVGCDAVRVGIVVPTEFGGTVRTVKELPGRFVEFTRPEVS